MIENASETNIGGFVIYTVGSEELKFWNSLFGSLLHGRLEKKTCFTQLSHIWTLYITLLSRYTWPMAQNPSPHPLAEPRQLPSTSATCDISKRPKDIRDAKAQSWQQQRGKNWDVQPKTENWRVIMTTFQDVIGSMETPTVWFELKLDHLVPTNLHRFHPPGDILDEHRHCHSTGQSPNHDQRGDRQEPTALLGKVLCLRARQLSTNLNIPMLQSRNSLLRSNTSGCQSSNRFWDYDIKLSTSGSSHVRLRQFSPFFELTIFWPFWLP